MPASTDDMLRALADGTRRDILRLVWTHERASGEIAARFTLTRQAISQHLGVLLGCGLLSVRADGTKRLYRARAEGLAALREFLDDMWSGALDAARSIAEEERGAADSDRAARAG